MIVFAAIAPHGDVDDDKDLRKAMDELGRRCDAAEPETAVVLTPHNVHVEGHFAVVTAARVEEWEVDRELAAEIHAALRAGGIPVLSVSFGGNDTTQAEHPLDWGTEIPLGFTRAPRIVVVCPARDLSLEEHVRAGAAIARAAAGRRVALIASADHGHAHKADGPYGLDPAAALYDARVLDILRSDRLDFMPLAADVEAAKADSLWQLLMLQGAVGSDARADLLAYACPSYYGMLAAQVSG